MEDSLALSSTPLVQRQACESVRPQSSAVSSAPTTPRRWSSGWRSRPGQHIQLDDVVAVDRILPTGRGAQGLRDRRPGACPPRGRQVPERRVPHRRRAAAGGGLRGGAGPGHPGRAGGVRARRCPAPRSAGPSATSGRPRWTTTRSPGACPPGSAATASRCTSTSTSSTAPRAPTSTSAASVAWPRRRATPRSCSYSLLDSGVLGAEAANTKALIFNVKGEDLLFLDHPNDRLGEDEPARYAALGLPAAAVPQRRRARPAAPGRPERHARRRVAGHRGAAVHVDHPPVLRAGPAAVPVRRCGGRAPAVHDRRPVGHGPAARAGRGSGRARRRGAHRGRHRAPLPRPGRRHRATS